MQLQLQYNDIMGAFRFSNEVVHLPQFEAVCRQMVNMNQNGIFEGK
jgi:hypothetical protein